MIKVLFFHIIKDHIASSLEPRLFQHSHLAPAFPPNGLVTILGNHSHNNQKGAEGDNNYMEEEKEGEDNNSKAADNNHGNTQGAHNIQPEEVRLQLQNEDEEA